MPGFSAETKYDMFLDLNALTPAEEQAKAATETQQDSQVKSVKDIPQVSEQDVATHEPVQEDEDGFIFLVDRKKDVIITGGENLYPVQIENFLRQHLPAIKDVAVIGLADQRLGEIAAAVIEVKEGFTLTEEDVQNSAMGLPRYQRPRKIIFADIPRNPTGKIEKPTLRKRYGSSNLVADANTN